MSGGSYEYLCFADTLGGLEEKSMQLQQMADDLARLGYADDAAQETQELILELRQARNRIVTSRGRLYKLWKAKEWWESCDYSEDTFKECLAEYRGDTKEVPNDTND